MKQEFRRNPQKKGLAPTDQSEAKTPKDLPHDKALCKSTYILSISEVERLNLLVAVLNLLNELKGKKILHGLIPEEEQQIKSLSKLENKLRKGGMKEC